MRGKKFGNQSADQIINHLTNLLNPNVKYNLSSDPLNVRFIITEAVGKKPRSVKRLRLRDEQKNLSKGKRKHMSTKKNTRPKIRSIKKGRTVPLKGVVY